MARSNLVQYGFRFVQPLGSTGSVLPEPRFIASAYATADIYVGDPVQILTDGSVIRTPAGTGGTNTIYGVVSAILQFRNSDGVLQRNGRYIPSGTTWTDTTQASMVMVIPARNVLFRAMGSASVADIATARALTAANADHSYATPDQGLALSGAQLNLATVGTTNTLQWRIHMWDEFRPSNDPTQSLFSVLCYPNAVGGIGGLGSNTGL